MLSVCENKVMSGTCGFKSKREIEFLIFYGLVSDEKTLTLFFLKIVYLFIFREREGREEETERNISV